ncbi:MAG: archease [Candidatus Woesearchaeota archaeon]
MRFEFFEHTADAKFRAYGTTLEEAFGNAALAMFSLMVDTEKVNPVLEKKISVDGADEKAVLYNFLEELLFLVDSESFLLHSVKKLKIQGRELTAIVVGDTGSDKYETHGDVKAVTYNEMEIIKEEDKVSVQVVLDI